MINGNLYNLYLRVLFYIRAIILYVKIVTVVGAKSATIKVS